MRARPATAADAAEMARIYNQPSRSLLRSLGVQEVGLHRRHGQLDGTWHDVVAVELLL
jgi:phosphinothricin acetyltransferase